MALLDLRQVGEEAGTTPPEKTDKELGPSTAHKPVDGHQWPKCGPHEACWAKPSTSVPQLYFPGVGPCCLPTALVKTNSLQGSSLLI